MNKFSSRHLPVVVSLALGLLAAGAANADTLTYTLVPIIQPDSIHPSNTDTVTGTFVISSTGSIEGTWSASNSSTMPIIDFTANLMMSSAGTVSPAPISQTLSESFTINQLISEGYITQAGLTISSTAVSVLNGSGSASTGNFFLSLTTGSPSIQTTWDPLENEVSAGLGQLVYINDTSGTAYYSSASSANPAWVIATTLSPVPEPGAMTLIGASGLLALGRQFLRRRRAIKMRDKLLGRCQYPANTRLQLAQAPPSIVPRA
jgi:hypothetical protein